MNLLNYLIIIGLIILAFLLFDRYLKEPLVVKLCPVPKDLGLHNGTLGKCPNKPKCVSTQDDMNDKTHYMDPIPFEGSVEKAQETMIGIANRREDFTLERQEENYVHFVVTNGYWGWLDSVEMHFKEEAGKIDFRSMTRFKYGTYDMKANRKRMEFLRDEFLAKNN